MLHNEKALENIETAAKICSEDSVSFVNVCIMKQRILTNMNCSRFSAQAAFEEAKKTIREKYKNKLEYADFLQSSIEYYRGEIAQKDLDTAQQIILENEDSGRMGAVYLNRGFDFFWQGDMKNAQDLFEKAKENFQNTKMHEVTYAFNNLASCHIMNDHIDEAIQCIHSGLLWGPSLYAEIVLKTQLLICLALKNDKDYVDIVKELIDFIEKDEKKDISILIKVNYNIGFAYKCMSRNIDASFHNNKAYELAQKTNRNALPYLWIKDFDEDIEKDVRRRVSREYYLFYQQRFEPWLLTIDHN